MKKLFRQLARKVFKKWIRVYQVQSFVSDTELVLSHDAEDYVKHKMCRQIVETLMNNNLIDFESEKDFRTNSTRFTAKIRLI